MSDNDNRPRSAGGYADLTIQNDVAGELELTEAMTKTLEYLAVHGGEVRWSWEGIKPATKEMVADLIEHGLVKEIEYVTHAMQLHGQLALRMTDKGRNVLEIHRKRKIVAGEVRPITA